MYLDIEKNVYVQIYMFYSLVYCVYDEHCVSAYKRKCNAYIMYIMFL